MTTEDNHYAGAAMLIHKPVNEVFMAFVDPAVTTRFWFTKSSGKLVEGQSVNWTWEMFNHTVLISVRKLVPNKNITIQWGDDAEALVVWDFNSLGTSRTFVTITNTGFKGSCQELISQIRDSTGGFTWVLAGLKAYLEHNLQLNLIADRYPEELTDR